MKTDKVMVEELDTYCAVLKEQIYTYTYKCEV